jgi:hypothetical protein
MFSSETIIKAAMSRRIDSIDADRALDIATRVERQITCHVTGEVLDSRTAFGLFDTDSGSCVGVVSPAGCTHDNVVGLLESKPNLTLSDAADVWAAIG